MDGKYCTHPFLLQLDFSKFYLELWNFIYERQLEDNFPQQHSLLAWFKIIKHKNKKFSICNVKNWIIKSIFFIKHTSIRVNLLLYSWLFIKITKSLILYKVDLIIYYVYATHNNMIQEIRKKTFSKEKKFGMIYRIVIYNSTEF